MSTDTPIEKYLKSSGSKGVKILLWLLRNRDKDNVLVITLDHVAAENNVTKVTVNRVFQKLYKDKFLVKIRNGQYRLVNV
jgi:DNA-binding IscR family transcriptional regulator